MSNHKKEPHKRVVFAEDHNRISPRSKAELYALETSELYELVADVYNNTPLFMQFSQAWQRRIRAVRRYSLESFIEDFQITHWVNFFVKVLMPMEDQWEAEQLRKRSALSKGDLDYSVLLAKHPVIDVYLARESHYGRNFSILHTSADKAREALRWCNLYQRIIQNQFFEAYKIEYTELDLSLCSYLQLREIAATLNGFERKALLVRQISSFETSTNLLRYHYPEAFQGPLGLLGLSERQLKTILKELQSMDKSGVLYDDTGELAVRLTNSD